MIAHWRNRLIEKSRRVPVHIELLESRILLSAAPLSTLFAAATPYAQPAGHYQFGTIGTSHVTAALTASDGTAAAFALTGVGVGTVTVDGSGHWSLDISGAAAASAVKITVGKATQSTSGQITLSAISVEGPLGSFSGPAVNLTGPMTATGSLGALTLNNLSNDGGINLQGAGKTTLQFGQVTDESLTSNATISSLTAAAWTDSDADADSITAPGLTKLTIQKGGLAANLNIGSSGIGTISISGGSLTGSVTDGGGLTSLTITGGDLGGSLNLGGPLGTLKITPVNGTGGNVLAGVAINAGTAAIGTFSVAGSLKGTSGQPIVIHAGAIATLSVTGAMDHAAVTLANSARKAGAAALGTLSVKGEMVASPLTTDGNVTTVTVTGALDNAAWYIAGTLNSLTAGSTGANWSADLTGKLATLAIKGDFLSSLSAASLGTVAISGSMTNARLLAGADLQANTYNPGSIASLTIKGAMNNSTVGAGLNPASDSVTGTAATSLIKTITISGQMDVSSLIAAAGLPAKVSLAGASIQTIVDPRFLYGGITLTGMGVAQATPGALMWIYGTGFDPASAVTVRFLGAGNTYWPVTATEVTATGVLVAVPPILNGAGQIVSGTVQVQVIQVSTTGVITGSARFGSLSVTALTAPGGAVGTLTDAFLKGAAASATGLEAALVGTAANTPAMQKTLATQAAGLSATAAKVEALMADAIKTFVIATLNGTKIVVDQTVLANVDALLLAQLRSQASPSVPTPLFAPAAQASYGTLSSRASTAASDAAAGSSNTQDDITQFLSVPTRGLDNASDTADAFGTALKVVGGGAAIGLGIIGLGAMAIGAEAGLGLAIATGALLYVGIVCAGGQIAVGGALQQVTADARALVQEGVTEFNDMAKDAVYSLAVTKVFGEVTGTLYDMGKGASDLMHQFAAANIQPAPLTTYQLTITQTGTGNGTVAASPAGPNLTYVAGQAVSLTPHAAQGSYFAGWAVGGSKVVMNSNQTVTAIFNLNPPPPISGQVEFSGSFSESWSYSYYDSQNNLITQTGNVGFQLTLWMTKLITYQGTSEYLIKNVECSDPWFGATGVTAVLTGSAASLPTAPGASTLAGEGFAILFPNGATLGTTNNAGDLLLSANGRTFSNSASGGWSDSSVSSGNSWESTIFPHWPNSVSTGTSWYLTQL